MTEASHPYYILAPDFRESSAGVKVLHHLCHMLNARGEEACIVGAGQFHPKLTTPALDAATLLRHRQQGRTPIAVYSDIVTGNPLNAHVCVRYMLNKEGVINGNPLHAGPDDLLFYYSPAFTPETTGSYDYLRLNTHDLDLFKPDPDRQKSGPLLYLNRIPSEAIDFARLPPDIEILSNRTPLTPPDLARKLQAATVLYTYESSGTCTLAMLCGCPVVALTHPDHAQLGFSPQALAPYGGRGYALTDDADALERARASIPSFRAALGRLHVHTQRELGIFIEKTQARARQVAQTRAESPLVDLPPSALASPTSPVDLTVVVIGATHDAAPETDESLNAQIRPADRIIPMNASEGDLRQALLNACGDTAADTPSGSPNWLALVDQGDALAPSALATLAHLCGEHPGFIWLHSDAEVRLADGTRQRLYPPDASPRLLTSGFALPGLLAVRVDALPRALEHAQGLNAGNWRQALPYLLLQAESPVHVPEAWAVHAQVPIGQAGMLLPPTPAHYELTSPDTPLVSILIPSRDQLGMLQRCVTSLFEQTRDLPFEIIIVAHETSDAATSQFLSQLPDAAPGRLRIIEERGPFNFSLLINRAAAAACGQFLLLLNNDTAALHPEWLQRMLSEFDDLQVGIVSPRLVFPDGRLQHAGAVLGLGGATDFPWVGAAMDEPGHLGLLSHARDVSAVTGAALMIRRELFDMLGGMDEHYDIAFGDFDLCLRASRTGYRCIWTPHATLLHEAGSTLKSAFSSAEANAQAGKAFQLSRARFLRTWLPDLGQDPHYNRNLSLTSKNYSAERDAALQLFPAIAPDSPRVLALPADDAGSGQYRVSMPARLAMQRGLAATRVVPGYPVPVQLSRLDIQTLFSQRQVDDNHLQALGDLRSLMPSLRIVMDFDDLLTEVPKHSHHATQVWPDIERRVRLACSFSDCVTASTEPLAQRLRAWHDDVRVVPNGIDPAQWSARTPTSPRTGKLRVGWAGGLSHAGDLAVIRKVVAALAKEVEWVFFGMCLEDMRRHLSEFHHGVPFGDYPAKLASLQLDLALAPLESNAFNECKSNLRLLEYGALGIPVIASDLLPYRCGLPVTLVDNRPQSWLQVIRERIGERDALQRQGGVLREAVLSDWTQEKMLPGWLDAWRG